MSIPSYLILNCFWKSLTLNKFKSLVRRAKLLCNFHSLEMRRNFSYCIRVHIQPLLSPPILDSFWMFVFHVNHMAVRLVSNLCNFPSVPCLKIKIFFVINFISLKLKYSLKLRSDCLDVASLFLPLAHITSQQQPSAKPLHPEHASSRGRLWQLYTRNTELFDKAQLYKRHLHIFTRNIWRWELLYSLLHNSNSFFHLHTVGICSIQHDAIASEQFCVVKWTGGGGGREVLGSFCFFCLVSLQRKKGHLSNSRWTFQYVAGYFNCKSNFNLRHVNTSMYCFMPSMNLRTNLSVYICFTTGSSFVNKLIAIMVNSHLLSQNLG